MGSSVAAQRLPLVEVGMSHNCATMLNKESFSVLETITGSLGGLAFLAPCVQEGWMHLFSED